MKQYIEACLSGKGLTTEEAASALDVIMSGQATDAQISGLLIALRFKGETVEELVGFAQTMRERAVTITVDDPNAIDIVGTGGDGRGTFNISTVVAFVVAGAGVTVAKHGNRSVSSQCGSADVLAALGVNIQAAPPVVEHCVNRLGIGFLFAPMFHPAMQHAARSRTELGVRTIFNMLGPITNPASVQRHVIGAYHPNVARQLAAALGRLRTGRACVVHSSEGLDEIGLEDETKVFDVDETGTISEYTVTAETFGLNSTSLEELIGGNAQENALIARSVLSGKAGAQRDVVIANAAMAIHVAGKASSLIDGAEMAARSIDSGRAKEKLEQLILMTSA